MKNNTLPCAVLGAITSTHMLFAALPASVGSKTVELWPIEWNSSIGRPQHFIMVIR